jgi:hypothetical protein
VTGDGFRGTTTTVGNLHRGVRMKRVLVALAAAVCVAGSMACHGPLSRRRRPQPTPPEQATTVVAVPVQSDGAWIDSVTKSWSATAAQRSPDSTAKNANVRRAQQPSSTARTTTPAAVTATSYAEAASISGVMSRAEDDNAPLVVLIAIGAIALLVAIEAGRAARRP